MRSILIFIFLISPAVLSAFQPPPDMPPGPPPTWRSILKSSSEELECFDAAESNGGLWLLIGSRDKGHLGGSQRYRLTELNALGERARDYNLDSLAVEGAGSQRLNRVYGMTTLSNGQLALVGEVGPGQPVLGLVDSRKIAHLSLLKGEGATDFFFTRVLSSHDHLIAIGRLGTQAALVEIEPTVSTFKTIRVADQQVTLLYDAAHLSDNIWALAGGHLDASGTAQVWVGKIDNDGKTLSSSSFVGRTAQLLTTEAGLTIAYGVVKADRRALFIVKYNDDLKELGTFELPIGLGRSLNFDVARAEGKTFLFASSDQKEFPIVSRVSELGQVLWFQDQRTLAVPMPSVWRAKITPLSEGWLVIFTVLEVDEGGEQREFVRVLKYSQ